MLALLGLVAALAPEAPPPPPLTPAPHAVVVRVDARLTGLEALLRSEPRVPGETRVRGEATPSRLRGMARTLVERARVRLAAGDADGADQLGAAASDTLSADRPVVLFLRLPPRVAPRAPRQPGSPAAGSAPAGVPPAAAPAGGLLPADSPPFWFAPPPWPAGFDPPHGFGGLPAFDRPPSPAERAARHLDHAAAMVAMTGRFAERGDAATLAGLARTALDAARRALAAADPAGADGAARRAETLARAALHAAIADDPALRLPRFAAPPPLLRHAPAVPPGQPAQPAQPGPAPPPGQPGPPGEWP